MRIKEKHIALLMMVAFFCATPIYAQKPLTKPEKPQTQSPSSEKKVSVEKGKMQTTSIEMDTIPQYIYKRKILYNTLRDGGVQGLGEWDEFNEKMDNPTKRDILYNALSKGGVQGLGTRDEFEAKVAQPKEK